MHALPIIQSMTTNDELSTTDRLRLALSVAAYANRRDIYALMPLLHPLVEVPSVPGVPPASGFRGFSGFIRYFKAAGDDGVSAEAHQRFAEVTEAGNVLATGELRSRTRDEGERSVPAWFVYRFRDGLVGAIETYTDAATALAAARTPGVDSSMVARAS